MIKPVAISSEKKRLKATHSTSKRKRKASCFENIIFVQAA